MVHDLLSGNGSSNEFRTVHGRLHGLLMLGGEPFDRSLVDKMEDTTSAGPSSSKIMHHEVGIFKGSGTDRFPSWRRHIMTKLPLEPAYTL